MYVLRRKIDALAQITGEYITEPHWERCYQKLTLAKGWIGKYLGEQLQNDNPYDQYDPTKLRPEDIIPTQDVAQDTDFPLVPEEWHKYMGEEETLEKVPYIAKIHWLRGEIEESVEVFKVLTSFEDLERLEGLYLDQALLCLVEAKMHLGYELGRLKSMA